jgi:hypothetical protein
MLRVRLAIATCLIFALLPALLSATTGSFRGVIVRGPDENPGWIWVKGANGMLRKVGVSGARVLYDNTVANIDRERQPELSMKSGTEVRVTANQDSDGEWRASKIEILRIKSAEPVIEPSRRNMDNVRTTI